MNLCCIDTTRRKIGLRMEKAWLSCLEAAERKEEVEKELTIKVTCSSTVLGPPGSPFLDACRFFFWFLYFVFIPLCVMIMPLSWIPFQILDLLLVLTTALCAHLCTAQSPSLFCNILSSPHSLEGLSEAEPGLGGQAALLPIFHESI